MVVSLVKCLVVVVVVVVSSLTERQHVVEHRIGTHLPSLPHAVAVVSELLGCKISIEHSMVPRTDGP